MDFLVNSVKAYFNRNWTREDMMSSAPISEHARTSLKTVYLSLFCSMSAAAYGSHFHFISEEEGKLAIVSIAASLLGLYFTPPWRVKTRVVLLMDAAFCFGASVGPFTKYFFEINQGVVVRFLEGAAIVFGCFWVKTWTRRERSHIYITVLIETCALMLVCFDITQWMLKVYVMLALFMGYLVLFSQEILYDARFGEIDFVNCTFTVFFCLPAIVVHAVRLCLGAKIEQHRQNK